MTLLIRAAHILTLDPAQPVIEQGAVLVEGEKIVAVGSYESLRQTDGISSELGDGSTWVLPGFINAHYHNWRTFSMGAALDAPLELFMLHMSGFEIPEELEPDFSYLNTLVSAFQLIRSGVTTTLDMTLSSNHRPMIQAYLDLGLDLVYAPTTRTQLGYVYTDDERFLATLPADLKERIAGKGLGLTGGYDLPDHYWQTWLELQSEFGDRIQLILAPDGPEWCSKEELILWCERASAHNTCLHLHNSESPMEMQWALKTHGKTMTEYLAEIGFLGPNVSCGHGVWYSDHDIELLAASGTTTVHCPSSNLRLSNGIAPVSDYLCQGVNVALGTDGQGFSDTSDYLDEMRLADLLQRTPGFKTKALAAKTVFEMATAGGAKAFMREQAGSIKVGNTADLVLLDGDSLSSPYLWRGYDPYTAVLQRARSQHINTVICHGKPILKDGKITTVDESLIINKLQQIYEILWNKQSQEKRLLIQEIEPYIIDFYEPWQTLPTVSRYHYNRN